MSVSYPRECKSTMRAHTGNVACLRVNQAGEYLLSGGADKTIRLWNTSSASMVKAYAGHGWEVLGLAISLDNAKFTSCGGDKSVFLWDVATGSIMRKYQGHTQRVNDVAFNADASVIISASYDASVRFWDVRSQTRTPIQSFTEAKDSVASICVHNSNVLSGSIDGYVRHYDLRKGVVTTDCIGHPVTSVSFTGDSNCALVSTLDSTVRLFDKKNGQLLSTFKGHVNKDYPIASRLDSTDTYVISGSEDGIVRIWDLVETVQVSSLTGHRGAVMSVIAHPTSPILFSGGLDGMIKIWS